MILLVGREIVWHNGKQWSEIATREEVTVV